MAVPGAPLFGAATRVRKKLHLGSERRTFLSFDYLSCVLNELPAEAYKDSDNIVARITLPTMAYARERLIDIFAAALRGLEQEPNTEKRLKYMDFIDTYSALDDNDRRLFAQRYPKEEQTMTTWSQRVLAQGRQEGEQLGLQKGEANILLRQLVHRFGPLGETMTERVRSASSAELERWGINFVDARTLDDVFRIH